MVRSRRVRRSRVVTYRDPQTGRYVVKGYPHAKRVVRFQRRQIRTGQFGIRSVRTDRHPRTGRFISKREAEDLAKKRVSGGEIDRIIRESPTFGNVRGFQKRKRPRPGETRRQLRRRQRRQLAGVRFKLRKYLRSVHKEFRALRIDPKTGEVLE